MRQEHPHWPPKEGELWVAASTWDNRGGDTCAIQPGESVLVLKEAMWDRHSSHRLTVMAHGTTRTIVAGPRDLNPLVWHTDTV
jgi:hypothetical protein